MAGLFRVGSGSRLLPMRLRTGAGARPAIFPVGPRPDGEARLELVDLDRDGEAEIVSATSGAGRGGGWRIEVFREEDGELAPVPELEPLAREALEEVAGEDGVPTP